MRIIEECNNSKSNITNINALESRAAQASPYLGCKEPECFIFSDELIKFNRRIK